MAWNGSGAFSRTNGVHVGPTLWVQDRDASVLITAPRHDTHDQDVSDGIDACLAKNGENAATANLNLGTKRYTNAGDATARTDLITAKQIQDASVIFAADAGANDTYVIALTPAITAYPTGMLIAFKANTINTGPATINANTVGAKTIKKNDDEDLQDGDIQAGQMVLLGYDGTFMQMLSATAGQIWTNGGVRDAANDGGATSITILNSAAAGSTDETVEIAFKHVDANGPGGKIVSARKSDYSSDANEDSHLRFFTALNGTDVEYLRLTELGALVGGGGTLAENANNTQGWTVDQGSKDDEAFTIKSSGDVAHGLTSEAETSTFLNIKKRVGAEGGVAMNVFMEDSTNVLAFRLTTFGGQADTGKLSSDNALIEMSANEHDGANAIANVTANGNVFGVVSRVSGNSRLVFIVDTDGDLFADAGTTTTAVTVFDDKDDALLVRAFDHHRAEGKNSNIVLTEFDRFVGNHREKLEEIGIIGVVSDKDHRNGSTPLINVTRLQQLHNGAIWQSYQRQLLLMRRLEERLPGITAALQADLADAQMPQLPI